MHWIFLTIVAIAARATFSIATKLLTNHLHLSSGTQSALVMAGASIISLGLSPFLGGISFNGLEHIWPTALIMVAATSFGNMFFFKGQQTLDASTTQIAFSSILIWGTGLSVLALGSRFSLWQLVGVLLLLAAIIAVQYQKGKRHIDTGVLFIVASAALFAAFQVTSARLAPVLTPGTYLVMTYLASTLLIGSVYAKTIKKDLAKLKDRLPVAYKTVGFAAGTMVMFYLFGYFAFQAAPDRGIVVILLTSQVILSVLLGIIFLKERSNMPRKIAAGIIAFIAAVLIKA